MATRGKVDCKAFSNVVAEFGFCFSVTTSQFLAEYLISGFAIELQGLNQDAVGSTAAFWTASLLTLVLSATLLVFARLSDLYGGYWFFMFGVSWLTIWTLIPGLSYHPVLLSVSRAMQGSAIAAFTPSGFAMISAFYGQGAKKNVLMGVYAGCAPMGFFVGMMTAAGLPGPLWYFRISSMVSCLVTMTTYLTIPSCSRRAHVIRHMDWMGAFFITSGLALIVFALAIEPYATANKTQIGFESPVVFLPLSCGLISLIIACWMQYRCGSNALVPFDFFSPRGVLPFSVACLCFYATYGVWLYSSAGFFQSSTQGEAVRGITLALWYMPTAVVGLILCIASGALFRTIPPMYLLFVSGAAWVAAPFLLAMNPIPQYWSRIFPSMICASLGIDLTFTLALLFFSAVQPARYQGLAGAMSSVLVNLGMTFSICISEIIRRTVERRVRSGADNVRGYQADFQYATGSAAFGVVICLLFVRIPQSHVHIPNVATCEAPAARLTCTEEDCTCIPATSA